MVVSPGEDPEVEVEAECSFPDDGLVASLGATMGVETGPYGGEEEGSLEGTEGAYTGVYGTINVDLTDDSTLSIDWAADFGPGGTLSGEIEGTETITDPLPLEIDYEVSFNAVKVED